MTRHHPPTELLLDFAAGGVSEAVALAVACHAEMCDACRAEIRDYERVGGALFETLEPEPVDDALLERVLDRLDEPEPDVRAVPAMASDTASLIPGPLVRYLVGGLDQLPWRRVGKLFEEFRLPLAGNGFKAKLMRLQPGAVMPLHTHRGQEYTLVLAGGYADQGEQFLPGDFDVRDPSHKHQPVVDDDGECLCLVVLDAPVKLTGVLGRIVNPFLRV